MTPIELLMREHRIIELGLRGLVGLAAQGAVGPGVPGAEDAREAIHFIRTFADRHHHGKEEDLLFARMESSGFSREAGPLGVMLHEHEAGRALVGTMSESLDRGDWRSFSESVREFASLLLSHIQKEDRILYPMAEQHLSEEELLAMETDFVNIESRAASSGLQERSLALATRLNDRYGHFSGLQDFSESDEEGCADECSSCSHCG